MLASQPALPPCEGFKDIDPAGYGEPVFDEAQDRDLCPCLPGVGIHELLGGGGLLQLMHPRERRRAWQTALEQVATPVVKTAASKRAVKRDLHKLQKETKARQNLAWKQRLRAVAADAGLAAARATLVPESSKQKTPKRTGQALGSSIGTVLASYTS